MIPKIPLAAEALFQIGSFPVTNAFVNALIATIFFLALAFFVSRTTRPGVPNRLQNFIEMVLEFLLKFFDQVTGDREKSKKFLPIAGTLFFFILFSNWLGLLPGTGSIGIWREVHGELELELVPFLRPANSDLNLTLAMALLSVLSSHILGFMALGFFTHANKFIQLGTIWKAFKSLSPLKILTAFVEFMVGIIEMFGEIAKIASLSLRLFGNIFAGEVLITVISSLVAFIVPLPFMALEIIVGLVQATVFAMLTLVYLNIASSPPHGSHDEKHDKKHEAHVLQPATH